MKLRREIDGSGREEVTKFESDCVSERRDTSATKSEERRAHNLLKCEVDWIVALQMSTLTPLQEGDCSPK